MQGYQTQESTKLVRAPKTRLVDFYEFTSYKNNNKIPINNISIKHFNNITKQNSKP